jgi:hypothetical protein
LPIGPKIPFCNYRLIFCIYLHFVLSSFPWTQPFAGQILHYLLIPLHTIGSAIITYIPNLVFIAPHPHFCINSFSAFGADMRLGRFLYPGAALENFETALCFSITSYTAIGYGDIVLPPRRRLPEGDRRSNRGAHVPLVYRRHLCCG